ncbi:MAG: DUF4468 domain-containing protein [Hymenobacter sp.]|nr:MAG: DUF4468 domain-containing protein [Hymenobacter sp.]
MKATLFACALWLPLAVSAQTLRATLPPITYHVGRVAAPLFRTADTLRAPSVKLSSLSEVVVVGRFSPQLVVVRREGFLYLTPISRLSDYDPDDANPLPLDPQTQLISYQGVVEVPGVRKADLYARAATWVAKSYAATDNDVQKHDPEAGELLVKGVRPAVTHALYEGVMRSSYGGVVRHSLTIYVKDGRYKYILTDLVHDAAGAPTLRSGGPLEQERASLYGYAGLGSKKPWDELKVEATRDARHLLADLQAAMTPPQAVQPVRKESPKLPSDF